MTSQEIERGNRIVAEFMEIPKCDRCDDCGSYKFGSGQYYSPAKMEYHSSWDWLVPVYRKINEIHKVYIDKVAPQFQGVTWTTEMSEKWWPAYAATRDLDLQKLWTAIVKFLEWYNSQQVNQKSI